MTHNCMCISHIKMLPRPLISCHTALKTLRDGSLQISSSLILIRLNSLCLAQSLSVKNLITRSQSTYSVILYHQQMQLGTLVSGLIQISHSLAMLSRSARLVLLMSRILSDFEDILTHEAALIAANALVGSCLDYCNSLFSSLSARDLRKLQCVQNSLATIVANTTKYSHITPVRKALHWLPIKYRSIFKTAVLVYKFLHSGNPKYSEPFLIPRHSAYNTRRSQSDGIFLPHFASVFKSRKHFGLSFACDTPIIWNDLPDEVRSANSLASFRSKLKSYLFGKAYPP